MASAFSTNRSIEQTLQSLAAARARVAARVREVTGKRLHNVSAIEIATYLEEHGDKDLGLRVRGYASLDEHDEIISEDTIVLFVVFGLVPGWWIANRVLASPRRSFRDTRHVYMYNDSWLLVFFVCPAIVQIATNEAFSTGVPKSLLQAIYVAALIVWLVRTPRLFKATHDASAWRVLLAQRCVVAVAFAVFFGVVVLRAVSAGIIEHAGL